MCHKTQHLQNSHTSRIYTPENNTKTNLETKEWECMVCLSLLVPIVDSRAYVTEASCSIMDGEFLDYRLLASWQSLCYVGLECGKGN